MSDYEATRQRHLASALERLPHHLERLAWSVAQLRDWRTIRLQSLLATARERSAWHRQRLAGLDLGRIDEDGLRALPTMTKDDLMAHFDVIVTDPRVTLAEVDAHVAGLTSDAYLLDDLHAVASGGSSGVRGVFVWSWEAWADTYLVNLRRQMHESAVSAEPAEVPVVMVVAADNAAHFTSANPQTFRSDFPEIHRLPVTLPLAEIVGGLNRINGNALVAYASMLGTLAAEARAGRLRISPHRVVSTAEPLLPEVRAAIEEVWQAPIANMWGTSEGGITALGCFRGEGMHLTEDMVIVEPVDVHGRPVPAGVRSAKVYLTNLCNPILPLIRYEITDEVTQLDGPCPCGSAHRRIADIEGRLDDLFRYAGGVTVHPHIFRSVLGREPRIVEYQVRQTAAGADVQVRVREAIDAAAIARHQEDELAHAGVATPAVAVNVVDAFPRQGTGKLKRFIPLSS
jgi:phenylacetate-coenzyme A ligase PaaK-like adenylate-forming protein